VLLSLGFDATAFITALNALSLQTGDRVIFVTPKIQTERAKRTRSEVEALLSTLAARGVKLDYKFLEVDEEDVLAAVASIAAEALSSEEVYVEATGGVRSLVVALTLTAVLLQDRVKSLHTFAESTGRRVKAPILAPGCLELSETERKILELADPKGLITLPYTADQLNLTEPTASRRLRELERKHLLQRVSERPATYLVTPLGRLALQHANKK